MITDVKEILDGDTLLTYKYNEADSVLPFSALEPYWSYANADGVEGWEFKYSDKMIAGYLTTASGQGGIAFIWDAAEKKIVHLSNADFAISLSVANGYFYTLANICYWGTPSTVKLYRSKIGTMNIEWDEDVVTDIPEDLLRLKDYSAYIKKISDEIVLVVNDEEQTYHFK